MISTLDLTVNSGDPVLERQSNDVNLTITATSSSAGSSINGNNLWKLTILVCEMDNCVGTVERRDTVRIKLICFYNLIFSPFSRIG